MPLDGFVASFEMMQAVMGQLVKDRVLKPKPKPDRAAGSEKEVSPPDFLNKDT